jgi:hypothetical protein
MELIDEAQATTGFRALPRLVKPLLAKPNHAV